MKPKPVLYIAAVCIGFASLLWLSPDANERDKPNDGNISFISPVELQSIKKEGFYQVAYFKRLDYNPNFQLGGSESFYSLKESSLKTARITDKTEYYQCGLGPDENFTTPDMPGNLNSVAAAANGIYRFDVEHGEVIAIAEECLP